MTKLVAFHNSPEIKAKYISRLKEHYKLDEIIKGRYWRDNKSYVDIYKFYEIELGIPEWIIELQELFTKKTSKCNQDFLLEFFNSIHVGFSNWKHIYHQICAFILSYICKYIGNPIVKQSIDNIIKLHEKEETDVMVWAAAESAALFAAESATRDIESATRDIESATRDIESATRFAAESAIRYAALSTVKFAAKSAAWSAVESDAKSAARYAVLSAGEYTFRASAYFLISEKLVELLEKTR